MYRITHGEDVYIAGDVTLESETEREFGLTGNGRTHSERSMRLINVRAINDIPLPSPAAFGDITITHDLTITTEEES